MSELSKFSCQNNCNGNINRNILSVYNWKILMQSDTCISTEFERGDISNDEVRYEDFINSLQWTDIQ